MSVRQYEEPIEEATARATEPVKWPIIDRKDHRAPSVFRPNLSCGRLAGKRICPSFRCLLPEEAIAGARAQNILAVEMEAAALYAFAAAQRRSVICFAHVTNAMAQTEGDFEKGEADGATATLAVLAATG